MSPLSWARSDCLAKSAMPKRPLKAVSSRPSEVFEIQAVAAAGQAGVQLELAEGVGIGHGRQGHTDAGEELAQVHRRDRQAAAELGVLVQLAGLQFAEGAQLVDAQLQAVPLGDLRRLVEQQLALGGEGGGLALQRLARGFAGEPGVFQLVAPERGVEAQVAGQLGLDPYHRLVGAEVGVELQRNAAAFANGAGAQLDALDVVLLAAGFVGVGDAGVVDVEAVDVELDRGARAVVLRRLLRCLRLGALAVRCRRGGGRSGRGLGLGRLADVFPVALALLVADQVQAQAFDADRAHLYVLAQQRQDPHRQAEHLQVGERLGRRGGAGDAGVVQLQAQPGEQAPADVALQVQLQVGLVAGDLADFVLVVIGIEQVGQGEAQGHDEQ